MSAEDNRINHTDIVAVIALINKHTSTVGELRAVLGLLRYYRQYVKDFSFIASPLYDLLKGPVETENMATLRNKRRMWQTK